MSVLLSVPVAGTWLSFLLAGGAYPAAQLIERLFVVHVYLAAGGHRGTHRPSFSDRLASEARAVPRRRAAPSTTSSARRSYRNYAAKSIALFLAVIAVVAALGALVQINPVWLWGPYDPWIATSPAQPDWYLGWVEGALRMGPALALHLWGHTVPSPFWPAVLLPCVLFAVLFVWPWIDAALRKDRSSHQLLDNPRDVPWRTALGVALFIFALGLTLAGSDDVQARYIHLPVTAVTQFYRFFCIVAPLVGFAIAYAFAARAADARRRHAGAARSLAP